MSFRSRKIEINTLPLFPELEKKLMELLQSLSSQQWQAPTIASRWSVKDIAAHLLDGNIRSISILRDHYSSERSGTLSNQNLILKLNRQNMSWTRAAKRMSPALLMELLAYTEKEYFHQLTLLQPFENAVFPVAWAGHQQSPNWFHIAREYTEKFIHQQQIREAVHKPGLNTRELFQPFLETILRGLPYTYRNTDAKEGSSVNLTILTTIGGNWCLTRQSGEWHLSHGKTRGATASVQMQPDIAWKLFSKGMTVENALSRVNISGNRALAKVLLGMVSVMA